MTPPIYLDIFVAPVRDNAIAQTGIAVVLVLIVLDIIFGLGNAVAKHRYSSDKMREGIAHKCAELGFVLVGIVCDATIIGGFDLGFTAPVLVSVCIYLALMEIGSLMETFADMNPQLAHSPLFQLLGEVTRKLDAERKLVESMPSEEATDGEIPSQEKDEEEGER